MRTSAVNGEGRVGTRACTVTRAEYRRGFGKSTSMQIWEGEPLRFVSLVDSGIPLIRHSISEGCDARALINAWKLFPPRTGANNLHVLINELIFFSQTANAYYIWRGGRIR